MYQRSALRHRSIPFSLRPKQQLPEFHVWFHRKPRRSDMWIAAGVFLLVVIGVLLAMR
jgi:hypothetical protein